MKDRSFFHEKVYSCLDELLRELKNRMHPGVQEEQTAAAEIHKTMVLRSFFRVVTRNNRRTNAVPAALTNHTACFCCLFGQAEHYLPCGHVLCTTCIRTYGQRKGPSQFEIFGCPMEADNGLYYDRWIVPIKPKSAGIRVLSLDG